MRTVTDEAIRYGFTGREHDGESGLIHFRARAYDPGTGMFLQRDPIGFAAGDLNLYAYVWNDPFNWTDPSGLAVVADYANLNSRSGGLAAGFAGLFSAIRTLAQRIALELAKAAISPMTWAGSGDDAGANSGAGSSAGSGGSSGSGGDGDGDDQRPDVEFGTPNDKNQQYDIDRHFDGADISREEAERRVREAIDEAMANGELSNVGDQLRARVDVNGTTVEFRAFNLGTRINVGTMFPI